MGLAGTDFAQHRDFADSAEQYRRMLVKKMNDDLAYNSGEASFGYTAGPELWASVPDFEYSAPPVAWVLGKQSISVGILLLWMLVAVVAAFRSTRSMRAV